MKNRWKFRKAESPQPGKATMLSNTLVSDLAVCLNPGKIDLIPSSFFLFEFLLGYFSFNFFFKCRVKPEISSFLYYFRFLICHLLYGFSLVEILFFNQLVLTLWVSVVV